MNENSITVPLVLTVDWQRPDAPLPSEGSTDYREVIRKALQDAPEAEAAYSVFKAEKRQRFTLGVAYAANWADVAKAQDGYRDFASPDELEQCAWSYLRKGRKIGMFHQDGTSGHADVVESYIYRGPDWLVKGVGGDEYVVKAGDWVLGAQWDELGFLYVENKLVQGWSPDGQAKRRLASADQLAMLRTA